MARRNARSVSDSIVRLSGSPRWLGLIDFTNVSKTNAQASTPFNNTGNALLGKILLLQPDQNCLIQPVSTSTGTTQPQGGGLQPHGVKIFANERVVLVMDDIPDVSTQIADLLAFLAVIRDTTSGELAVWELI